jgi:hypothetical protein
VIFVLILVFFIGFQDMPTLQPTPKARRWAFWLSGLLILHCGLAVVEFAALSIIDGFFDLIGAMVGFCAIRDPNRYNVYQVLCYCIYTGMDFFWGIIRVALLATKTTKIPGNARWQYELYVVSVIGGTILYMLACGVSLVLYRELRRILLSLSQPALEAGVGFGQGAFGGQQGQVGGYQAVNSQAGSVAEPFQGTAYKLGGSTKGADNEDVPAPQ